MPGGDGSVKQSFPPVAGSTRHRVIDNSGKNSLLNSTDAAEISWTAGLSTACSRCVNAGGAIHYSQTQTFDELGRLLRNIGANSQNTIFAYEKNSNLKSVTDPRGGLYSYAYDALNRLRNKAASRHWRAAPPLPLPG